MPGIISRASAAFAGHHHTAIVPMRRSITAIDASTRSRSPTLAPPYAPRRQAVSLPGDDVSIFRRLDCLKSRATSVTAPWHRRIPRRFMPRVAVETIFRAYIESSRNTAAAAFSNTSETLTLPVENRRYFDDRRVLGPMTPPLLTPISSARAADERDFVILRCAMSYRHAMMLHAGRRLVSVYADHFFRAAPAAAPIGAPIGTSHEAYALALFKFRWH